tara:strand:- start:10324 stop:12771 length:2448 start_codon:yes stop_codon:yes gene_type:complete
MGAAAEEEPKHKARAKAATAEWERMADAYERQGYWRAQAEQMASDDVKSSMRAGLQRDRHTILAQLSAERRNAMLAATSSKPEELPLRILEASRASENQMDSVVGMTAALMRQFNGAMSAFLEKHSRDLVGNVRNKAQLKDLVREMHGEASGDATTAAMAASVRDVFERARQMFNAAGGNIGKLDDHGIPHRHDRQRIMSGGDTPEKAFENWFSETAHRLDWQRIENFKTGKPFSTDGMPPPEWVQRRFMKEIFDNIQSDGWVKRDVTWGMNNGKALHNRYSEARVMHFKSADDWLAYNERYGTSEPYGAIVGHLHKMARDIAMMRTLGPSHTAGLENMINHAAKRVAGDVKAENRLHANANTARAMLAHISGTANAPHNETWAKFFGGLRQVLSAAHLGSAVLVSGSDSVAMGLAAKTIGANPANFISRHVKLLASSATREEAARMGYVADTLADAGNTMLRYLGESPVAGWTERMSSFVMRAQGLSFWTDMGRVAFNMEFAGHLAGAKTLDDLQPGVGDVLRARGITDEDWSLFADEALHFRTKDGVRFASPLYWRGAALDAGIDPATVERIMLTIDGLAQELTEVAVPSNSYEMRARFMGETKPGSISGELSRSFVSYKSYAMTFSINQYRQVMALPTGMARAQYVAAGMAGFTLMGAMGVQLKELAKGNEPRPMDDWSFWTAAGLQGGGLGIIGDLTSASTTRLGGGLMGYFAGPVVGLGNDIGGLTFGNMASAIKGEDMHLGRDAVKFAKRYTPGSTFFPTRAAMDRLVWDQMQLALDPEAAQEMRNAVRRQQREYGNSEIWKSGAVSPF